MKIVVQSPVADKGANPVSLKIRDIASGYAGRYKRHDTELIYRSASGISDPGDLAILGPRFVNDRNILDNIVESAAPDIDGVIVNYFFDSTVWPARQLLDIPVAGIAESAMTLAPLIGRRFAILSVNPRHVQEIEDKILLYGHRSNALDYRPVRPIEATEADAVQWLMGGGIEKLVDVVVPVARSCIADGAEVLILGCGLCSILLAAAAGVEEVDGVPIITPLVAAIKTAEALVDLHRAGMPIKSAGGFWGRPDRHCEDEITQ